MPRQRQQNYKKNLRDSLGIFAISLLFFGVLLLPGVGSSGVAVIGNVPLPLPSADFFTLAIFMVAIGAFFYGLWGIFQNLYFLIFRRN